MRYELTPDMQTGNEIIDGEHRELFAAVNQLMEAFSKGEGREKIRAATEFLKDYVQKHFDHEAQIQIRSGYPHSREHIAFHEKYKERLSEIIDVIPEKNNAIEMKLISGHISLLISHIRSEDKRLAMHIKQNP